MMRMNSIMERWVQTCRRELLERTLIWNQRHLLQALHEFKRFYNGHRPHQGIANARPLHPLPNVPVAPVFGGLFEQASNVSLPSGCPLAVSSSLTSLTQASGTSRPLTTGRR